MKCEGCQLSRKNLLRASLRFKRCCEPKWDEKHGFTWKNIKTIDLLKERKTWKRH